MRESIGKIPSRFQNLHHAGHSIGEEEDVTFYYLQKHDEEEEEEEERDKRAR